MTNVRECFVCSMLLARSERTTVEATPVAGRPTIVEVCVRCHSRVIAAGGVSVGEGSKAEVLRARPVQRRLFPAVSRKEGGGRGWRA